MCGKKRLPSPLPLHAWGSHPFGCSSSFVRCPPSRKTHFSTLYRYCISPVWRGVLLGLLDEERLAHVPVPDVGESGDEPGVAGVDVGVGVQALDGGSEARSGCAREIIPTREKSPPKTYRKSPLFRWLILILQFPLFSFLPPSLFVVHSPS